MSELNVTWCSIMYFKLKIFVEMTVATVMEGTMWLLLAYCLIGFIFKVEAIGLYFTYIYISDIFIPFINNC